MATLAAGNHIEVYAPLEYSITITPGSGGYVEFGCSSPSATPPAPRRIHAAESITIPPGSAIFMRAEGADATYLEPSSGSSTVITSYTAAQLQAMELAGTLTPYASYVASDIGEEFYAPAADQLIPRYARVRCSLPGFGGTWDGTTDDSVAIQAAIDYAETFDPIRHIELPPDSCTKYSIFIPSGMLVYGHEYVDGAGPTSQIRPHSSPTCSSGYMLNFNTTDGINEVVAIANGQGPKNGLFGVFCYGYPILSGVKFAAIAQTFRCNDVRASYVDQMFKKLDGLYIDNMVMQNISFWREDATAVYMIDIGSGGGDGLMVDNINCPNVAPIEKAIKVYGCGGGIINNCINGEIYLERCTGIEINTPHMEYGKVVADCSDVALNSTYWTSSSDISDYPIECTIDSLDPGTTTLSYTLSLNDAAFVYGDVDAHTSTSPAEINTVSQYTIKVSNARRFIRMSGASASVGIRLHNAGVAVDAWNANSFYLSMAGVYDGKFCHGQLDAVLGATMSGITWSSANANWGDSDLENGTTYYYTSQLLLDTTVGALIGVNQSTAEESQAVTTGQRVGLPFSTGANTTNQGMIRIYRGTSTGSYGYYADIPAINVSYIVDQGTFVNGVAWIDRGGGSAVYALTGGRGTYSVTPSTGALLVEHASQSVSYSATISVNLNTGTKVVVGTLTGNITHNSPTSVPVTETEVIYEFTQDGTGTRTITWSAVHKGAWPTGAGTAGQKKRVTGRSDGTNLLFVSDSGWY